MKIAVVCLISLFLLGFVVVEQDDMLVIENTFVVSTQVTIHTYNGSFEVILYPHVPLSLYRHDIVGLAQQGAFVYLVEHEPVVPQPVSYTFVPYVHTSLQHVLYGAIGLLVFCAFLVLITIKYKR
ncbi:MAG: hypothetical protein ACMXYC_03705 [Candidatus Woesearchaeota archaeon]